MVGELIEALISQGWDEDVVNEMEMGELEATLIAMVEMDDIGPQLQEWIDKYVRV